MSKKELTAFVSALFLLASWEASFAAEKINFASPVKGHPGYFLPILAAEKQGFWKENGLEAEWVPFRGGVPMMKAVAGGHISLGAEFADGIVPGVAAGIPVSIVSDLQRDNGFAIFALALSPLREAKDLKGSKVGVLALGSPSHLYAHMILSRVGLAKEVKYVGVGGVPEALAAVKAGAMDAGIVAFTSYVSLLVKGEVKEIARFSDYVTEERLAQVVYARKDLIKSRPEVVRAAVKAMLEASRFINRNRAWAINEIKVQVGFPEAAAAMAYDRLKFTETGKIDPRALENVKKSLIDFGLVPADKAPPTKELFTTEFTG